jgi:hypothetical protein
MKLQDSVLQSRWCSVTFINGRVPRTHVWTLPLQVDNNPTHFLILKHPTVPADSTTDMTHGASAAMNYPAVVSIMKTSTNRCIATHHRENKSADTAGTSRSIIVRVHHGLAWKWNTVTWKQVAMEQQRARLSCNDLLHWPTLMAWLIWSKIKKITWPSFNNSVRTAQ